MLLLTVTVMGFTVGHSVTLALAMLGGIFAFPIWSWPCTGPCSVLPNRLADYSLDRFNGPKQAFSDSSLQAISWSRFGLNWMNRVIGASDVSCRSPEQSRLPLASVTVSVIR